MPRHTIAWKPEVNVTLGRSRARFVGLRYCWHCCTGTGKTLIGHKLVQLLTGNSRREGGWRVLVLTYKNDALDAFLELCKKAPDSPEVARIGRGSAERARAKKLIQEQRVAQ